MKIFNKEESYPSLIISEEKAQVLLLNKKKNQVVSLAEVKLDKGVVEAAEVRNIEKLAHSLQSLMAAAKIHNNSVVVGIPENKSYTKIIKLPALKADELEEAVTWEAETYLPINLDQLYMDWKIIGHDNDEVTVLIIAVPKEIIDGYNQVLKLSGFSPLAFETTALSLVRLVEKFSVRCLVIEVGIQHAILTLTKGQAIESSSVVSFSDNQADNQEQLIGTINKMLDYYEKESENCEKVAKIFLCGERADTTLLNNITAKTKRSAEFCPISVANLPKQSPHNFSIATSLALKKIERPESQETINLLPRTIQKEYDHNKEITHNKKLQIISTVITSLVTGASLMAFIYLFNINQKLETEKLSLSPLPVETGKAIDETNKINRLAKSVIEITQNRIFPQQRLSVIFSQIPSGVKIVSIGIDELQGKIRISGIANTRASLLDFRNKMDSTEMFKNATLPLSSLQKAENIDFILTADVLGYEKK